MTPHSPSALEQGKTSPTITEPETPHIGTPDERPPRRVWPWVLLALLLIAGAAYYYSRMQQPKPTAQQTATVSGPPAGRSGRRGAGIPPVVAVKATKGNIGVYYTGLGAVTPIYTVSVKSRVDGQLMKVFYNEGQMVKQGDPLVDIDPRPYQAQLAQYEGALARDQASLENAKLDLARYEQLVPRKAVPEQTLATQRALVAQDEGNVKADQGQIEAVKLNIEYCHITAPISGRLGLRLVDPGNYIQAASATPLAVITQMDPISVIFTLPEDQLQRVLDHSRNGNRLRVDAYDREMNKKIASGSLSTIDNQIDQTTGTVRLRATYQNANGKLFPNQFVNAQLLVEEKRGVVLLSNAAIQRNSQSTYVYVVKPDKTVTIRQVKLGTTDGENTQVESGVAAGDVVVMTGVDKLQEGSKVVVHMADEKSGASGQANGGGQAQGAGPQAGGASE